MAELLELPMRNKEKERGKVGWGGWQGEGGGAIV